MPKLNVTKNDLPKTTRAAMVDLLNAGLADSWHLAIQAKQAHWNVKGPHFLPLHELFDKLYDGGGRLGRSHGRARGSIGRHRRGHAAFDR